MMNELDIRRLYRLFSELLDYPSGSLFDSADECVERLEDLSPEAARDIQTFVAFARGEGIERMEEIYTRTFDIAPTANLYVGYHLFGESYKRAAFLVKLQETYATQGFSPGTELADHLSVVLRFMSIADDTEFTTPLLEEGILPTIDKQEQVLKDDDGYGPVIRSLRCFLRQSCQKLVVAGG